MNCKHLLNCVTPFTLLLLLTIGSNYCARAQMQSDRPKNFNHFTRYATVKDAEVLEVNKDYVTDAEVGQTFAETPCIDCYEMIGKRTENTKTYAAKGSYGKHIWVQSSTDPMHLKNADGTWKTVQIKLHPDAGNVGVYTSIAAIMPITIDTRKGFVGITAYGKHIEFNRSLELIFVRADGTEQSLGTANWSNHTAGDEGVYVKNIWKGIDMEVYIGWGSVKTNFYINEAMPTLANGKLLIRDRMALDNDLSIQYPGTVQWEGNTEILDAKGEKRFNIYPAIAYEKSRREQTLQKLSYSMQRSNVLDIVIPGSMLNMSRASYPLVIDPLVQASNSISVSGSSYVTPCFAQGGCSYTNTVTVPPAITVTGLYFSFEFTTIAPTTRLQAWFDITMGTCRSPSTVGGVWNCSTQPLAFLPGQCIGVNYPIFTDFQSCIKPPQCASYTMDFNMRLADCNSNHTACLATNVIGSRPFDITIEGHTVEWDTTKSIATAPTICEQDSAKLYAYGKYGVPPYTYVWNPGAYNGQTVMVKPKVTTTYTATITDQCGNTAPGTALVNVLPIDSPGFYTTPTSICQGDSVTVIALGDSVAANYNWIATNSKTPTVTGKKTWKAAYDVPGKQTITLAFKSGRCIFYFDTTVLVNPTTYKTNQIAICSGETYQVGTHIYATTGTYVDKFAAIIGGCDSIVTTELTVNPIPPSPIVQPNMHACVGDSITLGASDIPDATYAWTGVNGYSNTMQNAGLRANTNQSGTYSVTATVKNCTSPPALVNLLVTDPPIVDIKSDKMEMCAGETAHLETPADPIYTSYRWQPNEYFKGDAMQGKANAVIGYPSRPVTVVVTDSFGCSRADTINIITNACCEAYLPDAFTPNADGKNDIFRMIGKGAHLIDKFIIVNRNGQVVYEGFDEKKGWDGTKDGEPLDMGTYFYYLKYKCVDNRTFEMKGDVTLIR